MTLHWRMSAATEPVCGALIHRFLDFLASRVRVDGLSRSEHTPQDPTESVLTATLPARTL